MEQSKKENPETRQGKTKQKHNTLMLCTKKLTNNVNRTANNCR